MIETTFLRYLYALTFCSLLFGCSQDEAVDSGPPRIPISGKVTLDGSPLESGTISFLPKEEGIRPTGGPIVNGEYNVPQEKGGNAGTYLVQIRSQKSTGKQRKDEDTNEMVDITKEAIPKKYNEESQEEVKLSDDNHVFNYDLTSK